MTCIEVCLTLLYEMLLYSSRLGIQPSSIRFTLDGERLTSDQTPKMLEMEDGDQIDARIEQQGGL
jgi:small ubiquitin-related modifier